MKYLLLCALLSSAVNAVAWDGAVKGEISTVEITNGANYAFRVWLSGHPVLCGNQHKWAYINESDSNYMVYVSALLAAKAAKQTVTVYTRRQGGAESGHCQIGHLSIQ